MESVLSNIKQQPSMLPTSGECDVLTVRDTAVDWSGNCKARLCDDPEGMGIGLYHGTGNLLHCHPEPAAFHCTNCNKGVDVESFLRNLIWQTCLLTTLGWCKSSMHKRIPERGLMSSFSL